MKKIIATLKAFLTAFPKWFGLYLGLAGLITFNLFIMEEAFQTCMFGSWPAQDAQEWRLVKKNIDTMKKIRGTMITMNCVAGWIHPFAFVAYSAYGDAAQEYIDGLTAKCLANYPEGFKGETVTVTFRPHEKELISNGPLREPHWALRNGRWTVLTYVPGRHTFTGILYVEDGKVTLDERNHQY